MQAGLVGCLSSLTDWLDLTGLAGRAGLVVTGQARNEDAVRREMDKEFLVAPVGNRSPYRLIHQNGLDGETIGGTNEESGFDRPTCGVGR